MNISLGYVRNVTWLNKEHLMNNPTTKGEVRRWNLQEGDCGDPNYITGPAFEHGIEVIEASPVIALLKEKDAEIAELKAKLSKCSGGCYI